MDLSGENGGKLQVQVSAAVPQQPYILAQYGAAAARHLPSPPFVWVPWWVLVLVFVD